MNPPEPLSPATATISLGAPGVHSIISILRAAAAAGIRGVEIFYNHLALHASTVKGLPLEDISHSSLLQAAQSIRDECDRLGLAIITLQPFAQYDGLLDKAQHEAKVRKFAFWIEAAHVLGCDIIQVPTNMVKEGTTGDTDKIVADIAELAELAAKAEPPVRIAYESMSWGAHHDLWEHSWEVVRRVGRENVGLCLDTYHIASRVWADPCSATGRREGGDKDLATSMARLVRDVDVTKVFYVQLSDAERLSAPLIEGHEFYHSEQPPRMSWSRNARLFPGEEERGGYFPVLEIARAIVNDLGYRGWISMEIFSRDLHRSDEGVPEEYAERAMASYRKVRVKLGWDRL